MNRWNGTVLQVDLTTKTIEKKPLDRKTALHYLAGRGFNSKTLFDMIPPGIDPLSPEKE